MLEHVIITLLICLTIIIVIGYVGETARKIYKMKYESRPKSFMEALTGAKAGVDDDQE